MIEQLWIWWERAGTAVLIFIAILLHQIKYNDLVHIYDRLGKVEKLASYNSGALSGNPPSQDNRE